MKYAIVPVTPFQQNCTVLWCEDTMRGVVVDPGGDLDRVLAAVDGSGAAIERVLLTHGHIDHAGGARELADRLGVRIEGPHRADQFLLDQMPQQGALFGLPPLPPVETDRWLDAGDTVNVGAQVLDVLHCPGHTPGHVVFLHRPSRLALVGDVVFRGSVGRTDLPGGSHDVLMKSIAEHLLPLDDETRILPGHGPMSTIGVERRTNPYLAR
ncbi:MAG TPA: MBL fold metallo-hydrolase [Arenibaculum sp.]|nr:MBL fold metallo-hydrolase [Arenibaculum sp.]